MDCGETDDAPRARRCQGRLFGGPRPPYDRGEVSGEPTNGRPEGLGELSVSIVETPAGLRIVGELTEANAHVLAAAVEPAVVAGRELVLDLSETRYVDAAALHLLAGLAGRLEGRGRIVLKSPYPWVRKAIAIVGVEELANVEVVEAPS
jgi:anti-anti-sigma factor